MDRELNGYKQIIILSTDKVLLSIYENVLYLEIQTKVFRGEMFKMFIDFTLKIAHQNLFKKKFLIQ